MENVSAWLVFSPDMSELKSVLEVHPLLTKYRRYELHNYQ